MPPETIKAACDEAHSLGYYVAAHVESPEGVRAALENGVDTIEHGAKPDKEILKLFKDRGAKLITTLSPALPYALFDREVSHASELEQFNGTVVFEGIKECANACLEAGIPVGLGTDAGCPYITHYDTWRELNYMHKYCGVSTSFALYSATKGNADLCEGNEAELFTTAWLGIYELSTGHIHYSDAGHDNPIIQRKDGSLEYVKPEKKRLMLAGMEGIKYLPSEAQMEIGDMLLIYTDGVPEATDANNELFGQERLENAVTKQKQDVPEDLLTQIRTSVDEFVGEAPQFDDLTMLALFRRE